MSVAQALTLHKYKDPVLSALTQDTMGDRSLVDGTVARKLCVMYIMALLSLR
ncbi:hypothetical protein [Oligella urethralis]|uniref:hypothetical protein n=1 Tax=Oligella urethralis TaxID=90245 RepID=UPI00039C6196|nr:hypothetical protein [Oligella urethralis]